MDSENEKRGEGEKGRRGASESPFPLFPFSPLLVNGGKSSKR
jgi:hypothetical protein